MSQNFGKNGKATKLARFDSTFFTVFQVADPRTVPVYPGCGPFSPKPLNPEGAAVLELFPLKKCCRGKKDNIEKAFGAASCVIALFHWHYAPREASLIRCKFSLVEAVFASPRTSPGTKKIKIKIIKK